ncbi:hypothetical protein DDQ50_01165 [Amnibacterium flavum]|uniref:Uncharacterized protein n=1 Tax=Amnibacterium flavum TaxID=2173173 RepID=A0A2V1HVP6_9MICO|nr:hypothetical protein DDQ50_01165 [Amnibacterium flavum]
MFVTVLGTLLAVFLADLISHLAVNTQLPTRSELGHMYRVTFGALGTVTVPLILVGLSALDVMSIEAALRASTIVLLVSLILISYVAVRRIPMPFWQRAVVLLAEGALGAAVVALELLAHG